jgi:hypothetical protein
MSCSLPVSRYLVWVTTALKDRRWDTRQKRHLNSIRKKPIISFLCGVQRAILFSRYDNKMMDSLFWVHVVSYPVKKSLLPFQARIILKS